MEQKKLNEALKICLEQCEKLGIPCGKIVSISPARRGSKRWGVCKVRPYGYMIEINRALLEDDVSKAALLDTVMHEVLHTCKDCCNHGAVWKSYATMVNRAYGYNIKRTTSAEEKGIEVESVAAKYRFQCAKCGAIIGRARESAFTRNPDNYRCARCKGKFIRL